VALAHTHVAVSAEQTSQPCGQAGSEQGLPCCVAAQCAFAVGALPPDQVDAPQPGTAIRYLLPAGAHFGIEMPPSLPPPRRGA
jgi:hypothetical protein